MLVHSEPLGATLVIGKQATLPHMLELEVDKPVQGLVSLPGHVSQSVTIDGSTPKIKVQLKAQGKRRNDSVRAHPHPSPPPSKRAKKPAGMVEPW